MMLEPGAWVPIGEGAMVTAQFVGTADSPTQPGVRYAVFQYHQGGWCGGDAPHAVGMQVLGYVVAEILPDRVVLATLQRWEAHLREQALIPLIARAEEALGERHVSLQHLKDLSETNPTVRLYWEAYGEILRWIPDFRPDGEEPQWPQQVAAALFTRLADTVEAADPWPAGIPDRSAWPDMAYRITLWWLSHPWPVDPRHYDPWANSEDRAGR